ncbi:hypothetical protein SAMN04488056_101526 [Cohaesibacter marisflavi]|uniref:Uncharacterized protein n=1 Tax=Cohaesibacter marisflavi TaxID=655353 RepID=A0A1I5AKH8_9HYPH|nr:hypothetical protein SAMN04488056_101526 [Cohaesibacter marisflavi]
MNVWQTLKNLTDRAGKILTDRADNASVLTTKEAFGKKNRKTKCNQPKTFQGE